MQEIKITANDAGRRLDRFLRKYFRNASLSEIYKIIRKDVKVDGRRRPESYMLQEGETLALYMSDETISKFIGSTVGSAGTSDSTVDGAGISDSTVDGYGARNCNTGGFASVNASGKAGPGASRFPDKAVGNRKARRQFNIVFEDDNILIADKPFGLLTHGDVHEKKNHLANQVKDYLIEKGEYNPRAEKVFSPAPANRIDRNTTGLVLFGKNATALKGLNRIIREDRVSKFYLTIVSGRIDEEMDLCGTLVKDRHNNKVRVSNTVAYNQDGRLQTTRMPAASADGTSEKGNRKGRTDGGDNSNSDRELEIRTIVRPLEQLSYWERGREYYTTLVEVELVTGRSHQIRAHLAEVGHPIIGDSKYANRKMSDLNNALQHRCGLSTQLLHAYRLEFAEELNEIEGLEYLAGCSFVARIPDRFRNILIKMNSMYEFD